MIPTTSLFIDKYHPKANGECAISLRITFQRKKKYYHTGITLTPAIYEKVIGKRPGKDLKNIALELDAFEGKATVIIKDMKEFSWATFDRKFKTQRTDDGTISNAFEKHIKTLNDRGRIGSVNAYNISKNTFLKFDSRAMLSDVTIDLLRKFEAYRYKDGKSVTTINIALTHLKTLINIAIDNGDFPRDNYPFGRRKYEIPKSNNPKKALDIADIQKIYNYVPKLNKHEKARDMWLFMYLANGLNIKDLCRLKYTDIKDNFIVFIRSKTELTKRTIKPIKVPLSNDLKKIIKKWGCKDRGGYIFDYLWINITPQEEVKKISLAAKLINTYMREIAFDSKINTKVTTYSARHSFATILQRADVSTGFISEALGHSSVLTTQNYLAGFEDSEKKEVSKILTLFKKNKKT